MREESRGAHYRQDFPEQDPRWLKNICLAAASTDDAPRLDGAGAVHAAGAAGSAAKPGWCEKEWEHATADSHHLRHHRRRRRSLYIKALTDIPQDVRAGLKRGYDAESRAGNKTASKVMLTVLENIKLADDKDMMVCQDTGLPIYKVLVGSKLQRSTWPR